MTTPAEPRSAESVFDHIFTTDNPQTGSKPPASMAWVVFEHGTAFFSEPTEALPPDASADALVEAARAALDELGPAVPGGPAGDFNVSRLDAWLPDEFVYFVTFGHGALATVVTAASDGDAAAGLEARSRRDADVREKKVALVRTFDGVKAPAAR